jgi:DsbC/DsbD-like thiol-disulfide interchange protein
MKVIPRFCLATAGVWLCVGLALMIALAHVSAQDLPNPASIVKPKTYVSVDKVPAGSPFDVAIVVAIQSGYHMNSHKPTESYLIPTEITMGAAPGFKEEKTTYPDGQMMQFQFSKEKLSVYSGQVTLRARIQSQPDAATGEVTLPFTLRFQACNQSACLPPTKVSVPVKLQVAAAGTKPQPANSEIFKDTAQK